MGLSPTFLVIFLQKFLRVHDRIDRFEDQREVIVGDRARVESSPPVIPELDVESADAGVPEHMPRERGRFVVQERELRFGVSHPF